MKTFRKDNFRVEVTPRSAGDFGIAHVSGLFHDSEEEIIRKCEEIAEQIRRHVDGLPTYSNRGVYVMWDSNPECSYCGSRWTEDTDEHNGGCCFDDGVVAEAAWKRDGIDF